MSRGERARSECRRADISWRLLAEDISLLLVVTRGVREGGLDTVAVCLAGSSAQQLPPSHDLLLQSRAVCRRPPPSRHLPLTQPAESPNA
mmetsp:Transcript_43402/g.122946  ORF Transcript_43402/g.122946 Transcript_43402/m.122946 type:complete len:90 (+) Transcript_43402:254-523(+)